MTDDSAPASRNRKARTAGLALLTFTILSMLHFGVIELNLIVSDDTANFAAFIQSSEPLFRAGIGLDLLIFMSGTVFSVALYGLLRHVDETLALLALLWMLLQASLSVVIELSSFATLLLFRDRAYLTAFEPDQLRALGRLLPAAPQVRVRPPEAGGLGLALVFAVPAVHPGENRTRRPVGDDRDDPGRGHARFCVRPAVSDRHRLLAPDQGSSVAIARARAAPPRRSTSKS